MIVLLERKGKDCTSNSRFAVSYFLARGNMKSTLPHKESLCRKSTLLRESDIQLLYCRCHALPMQYATCDTILLEANNLLQCTHVVQ